MFKKYTKFYTKFVHITIHCFITIFAQYSSKFYHVLWISIKVSNGVRSTHIRNFKYFIFEFITVIQNNKLAREDAILKNKLDMTPSDTLKCVKTRKTEMPLTDAWRHEKRCPPTCEDTEIWHEKHWPLKMLRWKTIKAERPHIIL